MEKLSLYLKGLNLKNVQIRTLKRFSIFPYVHLCSLQLSD
jgi:hypothetical protein